MYVFIYVCVCVYIYIYIYIYKVSCARNDRNQSTTDRRFYSHCAPAAIDDDSAKRNKTSLQYLLRRHSTIRRCAVESNFSNSASMANRSVAVLYDRFPRCSRLSFRLAHTDIYACCLCPRYRPNISPHKFSHSQSISEKSTRIFHAAFSFCERFFIFEIRQF